MSKGPGPAGGVVDPARGALLQSEKRTGRPATAPAPSTDCRNLRRVGRKRNHCSFESDWALVPVLWDQSCWMSFPRLLPPSRIVKRLKKCSFADEVSGTLFSGVEQLGLLPSDRGASRLSCGGCDPSRVAFSLPRQAAVTFRDAA